MGILFVIFIGVFIYVTVQGISEWSYSNSQPQISYAAKIIDKVSEDTIIPETVNNVTTTRIDTDYYVIFSLEDGETKKIKLPYRLYKTVHTGDSGTLIMQGSRFISFE